MSVNDPLPGGMPVSVSDAGEQFTRRVQRAATRVLGDSDAGIEIVEFCRHHHEARSMVIADRADNATVVAIVGTTGQGKSWLARQLVGDPAIAAAIRSGNNLDEATEKLTWVGPKPPSDLDTRHERYLVCDASKMQSIGGPYLIVDAPGSTDDRRAIAGVAERALSLASVLVLVVRRDQLRSQRVTGLASASEGTIVIPVVNMVGVDEYTPASGTAQRAEVDNDLTADIETLVSRLRSVAPQSSIASAVMIRDFEIDPRGEEEIGKQAAEEVAGAISEALAESGGGDHRRSTRLSALDARFTAAVGSVLTSQLPELTAAVDRLDAEARRLPTQIASTLLGGEIPLKAAIRSRLRLSLLSETAAIWFPYRTVLSVLNLTHGAWDRVLLSFSGSIPSLVGAVYTSVQNIRGGHESALDLRNGLRQRASIAVAERLGPMASRFRRELQGLHRSGATLEEVIDDDSPVATLAGVDALQEGSQAAFEETIAREGVSGTFAFLAGLIGTIIFWALMAGPLIALYHNYLDASYVAIGNLAGGSEPATTEAIDVAVSNEHANDWLQRFPHPSAGMLFTSVLLSLLPMAIFAMIVLSVCQGRRRIERIARSLRTQHDNMIETLQRDGVLRLRWSDPILADAEFLLSIGRMAKTHDRQETSVVSEDAK